MDEDFTIVILLSHSWRKVRLFLIGEIELLGILE
jgi:hypothetical protein